MTPTVLMCTALVFRHGYYINFIIFSIVTSACKGVTSRSKATTNNCYDTIKILFVHDDTQKYYFEVEDKIT